jgi:hypothetical protein
MKPSQSMPRGIAVLAALAWAGLTIGCGKSSPLGERRADSGMPGGGGTTGGGAGGNDASFGGTGGGVGGATVADASTGTGGATVTGGSGGRSGTGGVIVNGGASGTGGRTGGATGTAGRSGTGGAIVDGGAPGSGGRTGVGGATGGKTGTGGVTATGGKATGGTTSGGGATGTGGSTGAACGGPSTITCPQGQLCDVASNCGQIADATGACVPINPRASCSPTAKPVCGCEGQTYSNDCQRLTRGMLKAADGVCQGGSAPTYPTAYLVWQVPASPSETGPAVVIDAAAGRMDIWNSTAGFSPETPPANPTTTKTMAVEDTDSLWVRLVGVPQTNIPHGTPASTGCNASLYFRHCKGCAGFTVRYSDPAQVTPDLDPLWGWFDLVMGGTDTANPRTYCD